MTHQGVQCIDCENRCEHNEKCDGGQQLSGPLHAGAFDNESQRAKDHGVMVVRFLACDERVDRRMAARRQEVELPALALNIARRPQMFPGGGRMSLRRRRWRVNIDLRFVIPCRSGAGRSRQAEKFGGVGTATSGLISGELPGAWSFILDRFAFLAVYRARTGVGRFGRVRLE